ncbi:MAG: amidohydrolase family protein [Thaumarchaeota archaeon]|nr:amidohydrolase family protein [Candidatus Calditenuaceae archaeon]MDW8187364.1 amidohydrolase family protein [Nitrososphaerota archaeon]
MIVVETPDGKRHDVFVMDYHTHIWDARPENWLRPQLAKGWIDCFYDYHKGLSPEEYIWDYNTFLWYGVDRTIEDVFVKGHVDVAVFMGVGLRYFYRNGFDDTINADQLAAMHKYPDRFVNSATWDPRDGEAGLRRLEDLVKNYRVRPWQIKSTKLYTAEWKEMDGTVSKGWRLDSKEAFEYLEKNRELGISIQVPHKGPTVWPLSKDSFDVHDVDTAATSFQDLTFVVTHSGAPRIDDFCWIATQEKNVYAGLAVVMAFIHKRPRYFAEVLGELLFWCGPDRILYGSDYALWHPKWLTEEFLKFELPKDVEKEYGVELTLETKKKILGENAAKLWGIDVNEAKKKLAEDAIAKQYNIKPPIIKIGK